MDYRSLTALEINALEANWCTADSWDNVKVREGFRPEYIRHTRFSGDIRLGVSDKEFHMAGGIRKHSGIFHAILHNVEVGDDCYIENVKNYIANYRIGHDTFIENVDIILTDGKSSFGNGVEVAVLNETGGREVMIYDRLSAQQAYVMALYRHRPELISAFRKMIGDYTGSIASETGTIGSNVTITDAGYLKNVRVGDYCKIEGTARLKNGTINSNETAPVHIGVGVIGDDFIVCSGSSVEDGVMFSRCFIGQSCRLGHGYSASDSLFFSNCQGENGEACAIFAGPYTVTHHKSTLLIAGMFSFMNAGSGSNQSNHMYKLGPIHQGIMERGAKTASDSYLLWPAKIGAFSLVMGRHATHQDTSDLPFSYLIEEHNTSYIMPGANLKSVGTIRDARKWPVRDARKDPDRLDCINYNLLSPFTIKKMLNGLEILDNLQKVSGVSSDAYSYQSGKIKRSSLVKGVSYYRMAIDKFLGNSLITRLSGSDFKDVDGMRACLKPDMDTGSGQWIDLSGLIAPKSVVDELLDDIEQGRIAGVHEIHSRFCDIHSKYYTYEWIWAKEVIEEYFKVNLAEITVDEVISIIQKWKTSVVALDEMLYEDAKKEFSLNAMTSFGADGDENQRRLDFMEVRGNMFESDPFVCMVKDHIKQKTKLGNDMIERLDQIAE